MSFYSSGNVRDLFYFEKPVINVAGRYILTEVCFSLYQMILSSQALRQNNDIALRKDDKNW